MSWSSPSSFASDWSSCSESDPDIPNSHGRKMTGFDIICFVDPFTLMRRRDGKMAKIFRISGLFSRKTVRRGSRSIPEVSELSFAAIASAPTIRLYRFRFDKFCSRIPWRAACISLATPTECLWHLPKIAIGKRNLIFTRGDLNSFFTLRP